MVPYVSQNFRSYTTFIVSLRLFTNVSKFRKFFFKWSSNCQLEAVVSKWLHSEKYLEILGDHDAYVIGALDKNLAKILTKDFKKIRESYQEFKKLSQWVVQGDSRCIIPITVTHIWVHESWAPYNI